MHKLENECWESSESPRVTCHCPRLEIQLIITQMFCSQRDTIAVMLCLVRDFLFFFLSPSEPANENVWNEQSAAVTPCWSSGTAESHKCTCWVSADNLPLNEWKTSMLNVSLEVRQPKNLTASLLCSISFQLTKRSGTPNSYVEFAIDEDVQKSKVASLSCQRKLIVPVVA